MSTKPTAPHGPSGRGARVPDLPVPWLRNELMARLKSLAEAKVRTKLGPGGRVTQRAAAEALGVLENTYSCWMDPAKDRIPHETRLTRALQRVGASDSEVRELLALRTKAQEQVRRRKEGYHFDEGGPVGAAKVAVPAQVVPHDSPVTAELVDLPDESEGSLSGAGRESAPALAQHLQRAGEALDPATASQNSAPNVECLGVSTSSIISAPPTSPGADSLAHPPAAPLSEGMSAALQDLNDAVLEECNAIASDPRYDLHLPLPIPLRWKLAPSQPEHVVETAVAGGQLYTPRPLPGAGQVTTDSVRAGGPTELYALFGGLPSGRLVLTGPQGRGKSTAAILTMLEVLRHRGNLPESARAEVPVPVQLSANTWNPRRQSLRTWLVQQLATSYDFLTGGDYGRDAHRHLVQRGRIALFLEGLEQLDPGLRREALKRLASEHAIRVMILSRSDEYADAAAAVPLPGALILQLLPVPTRDAIAYLTRRQEGPGIDHTRALIEHLQQQEQLPDQEPRSPLAQALDSPLNLILLRSDPAANGPLLTLGQYTTRREVEDFLLARLVTRAYSFDRPQDPSQAEELQWRDHIAARRQQLAFLADWMQGNDLAWWQIHFRSSAAVRCAANCLAGVVVMSGVGALVFGKPGHYTVNGHTGIPFGLKYGAFMGAVFGALAGMISETRDLRPRHQARIEQALRRCCPSALRARWRERYPVGAHIPFNPAIALLVLAVVSMAVGNQSGHPWGHLLFGLPAGVIAAAAAGYSASSSRLAPIGRSRWALVRPSRSDLLVALSIGVPIGLTYALTKTTQFGVVSGVFTGCTFGFMISMARPRTSPDNSTTPFSRRIQDRQRALRVALAAATPIGGALGLQNGLAHGPIAGITAILGLGTIITLGCMAALSDSWRTTLTFAQIHLRERWRAHRYRRRSRRSPRATTPCTRCEQALFPLNGMRFLREACDLDLMRPAGPYIRFWHARLQELLATTHTCEPSAPTPEDAESETRRT